MRFTTIKIAGSDALAALTTRRAAYPTTGEFPFLIGGAEELERVQEAAELNDQSPEEIIQGSLDVNLTRWLAESRREVEEYGFAEEDVLGRWPGEVVEKGAISLHKDIVTGKVRPEAYLGFARIEHPWQLPAVLKYGGWNECPAPEVHCAFHRKWQAEFGAQITGMSGDVIECAVVNPPRDQQSALALAWEQYWYCSDIVEQGCGSVNSLAATLLDSDYWFFWWD
jgi:hypothetical protein